MLGKVLELDSEVKALSLNLKALSMRVTQTQLCLPLCEQDTEGGKKQKSRTFHKVAPLLWESEGDTLPASCLPSAPLLPEDLWF